jgi:hypothetical protein
LFRRALTAQLASGFSGNDRWLERIVFAVLEPVHDSCCLAWCTAVSFTIDTCFQRLPQECLDGSSTLSSHSHSPLVHNMGNQGKRRLKDITIVETERRRNWTPPKLNAATTRVHRLARLLQDRCQLSHGLYNGRCLEYPCCWYINHLTVCGMWRHILSNTLASRPRSGLTKKTDRITPGTIHAVASQEHCKGNSLCMGCSTPSPGHFGDYTVSLMTVHSNNRSRPRRRLV